jgi:hypothetical protein
LTACSKSAAWRKKEAALTSERGTWFSSSSQALSPAITKEKISSDNLFMVMNYILNDD